MKHRTKAAKEYSTVEPLVIHIHVAPTPTHRLLLYCIYLQKTPSHMYVSISILWRYGQIQIRKLLQYTWEWSKNWQNMWEISWNFSHMTIPKWFMYSVASLIRIPFAFSTHRSIKLLVTFNRKLSLAYIEPQEILIEPQLTHWLPFVHPCYMHAVCMFHVTYMDLGRFPCMLHAYCNIHATI